MAEPLESEVKIRTTAFISEVPANHATVRAKQALDASRRIAALVIRCIDLLIELPRLLVRDSIPDNLEVGAFLIPFRVTVIIHAGMRWYVDCSREHCMLLYDRFGLVHVSRIKE